MHKIILKSHSLKDKRGTVLHPQMQTDAGGWNNETGLKNVCHSFRDFPGGPVVKNPPSNAGGMGLISGQGTKIPHTTGQLSPHRNYRAHVPQLLRLCAVEPT